MHYRREIDGLRAIAVGSVVLAHAGAPLAGGHLGVDIFFVISGYLITTILMRERAEGRFGLWRFYERRARRILPALGVVAAACLPLGWMLMPPDQFTLLGQSLVALGVFATNVLFWMTSGYFAPASAEIPLLHTWSLAVEEQFYLLCPLVLMALWRRPRLLLAGLAGVALLSYGAMMVASRSDAAAAFYLLPFRAWELLVGVLLALSGGRLAVGDRAAGALALAGLALIVGGVLVLDPALPMAPAWSLVPVVGTALVLATARPGGLAHRFLCLAPLGALGLISYSVYLWHQPVFAFARIASVEPPSPGEMAALTALVSVLGWATWRWVERPFRDPRRIGVRPVMLSTGAALATLLVAGAAVHLNKGFGTARFGPDVLHVLETAKSSPVRRQCHFAAHVAPAPGAACVLPAGAPARWAVLGDSHGVELAWALAQKVAPGGEGLVQLTASACPPALAFDAATPGCRDWVARSVAWLERQPQIHSVVLAWRHPFYLRGALVGAKGAATDAGAQTDGQAQARDDDAVYWRSLGQIVHRLSAGGDRRVVLMLPVPELPYRIQKYAVRAGGGTVETIAAADDRARSGAIARRLEALGAEILPVPFCGAERCVGAGPEGAYYFDSNHLSLLGAVKVIAGLNTNVPGASRVSMRPRPWQTSSPPAFPAR